MAELTITAASVIPYTTNVAPTKQIGIAGEALTQGQAIYLKSSDSKWYLAQNDGTSAEAAAGAIAVSAASANQSFAYQSAGDITIGATVVVGTHYFVGPTAGGIGVFTDIASTKYITRLGYAITTSVIRIDIVATGLTTA